MFRTIIGIIAIFIISFYTWPLKTSVYNNGKFGTMKLKNTEIKIEFVELERDWYNGLSNRSSLCAQCGMMFNFFESAPKTFVMREMNFPLDILWFNRGELIGISENLPPEGKEPYTLYPSSGNVDQVLELNAGFAKAHNIAINDRLE